MPKQAAKPSVVVNVAIRQFWSLVDSKAVARALIPGPLSERGRQQRWQRHGHRFRLVERKLQGHDFLGVIQHLQLDRGAILGHPACCQLAAENLHGWLFALMALALEWRPCSVQAV
jgi:hypothetical protein